MHQVRDFSFGFARSGGDPAAFARGVGSLAQRNGINDWEKDEKTCRAIGEGLRDAGIGATAAQSFVGKLVPADSKAAAWMREGFHGK
jgi:hypothetical protein